LVVLASFNLTKITDIFLFTHKFGFVSPGFVSPGFVSMSFSSLNVVVITRDKKKRVRKGLLKSAH